MISIVLLFFYHFFNNLYCMHCMYNVVVVNVEISIKKPKPVDVDTAQSRTWSPCHRPCCDNQSLKEELWVHLNMVTANTVDFDWSNSLVLHDRFICHRRHDLLANAFCTIHVNKRVVLCLTVLSVIALMCLIAAQAGMDSSQVSRCCSVIPLSLDSPPLVVRLHVLSCG